MTKFPLIWPDGWKRTEEQARQRYRELAATQHPDVGGSDARMAELNRAWEDAQRELNT